MRKKLIIGLASLSCWALLGYWIFGSSKVEDPEKGDYVLYSFSKYNPSLSPDVVAKFLFYFKDTNEKYCSFFREKMIADDSSHHDYVCRLLKK